MSFRTFCLRCAFLIAVLSGTFQAYAQPVVIPSMGTEFWVGFMYNPVTAPVMKIFISSSVNTTGNVQVPGLGMDIPFTVAANVTTTVSLLANDVMHPFASEIVDNRAVLVTTADTVSVFAINLGGASADAAVVYPYGSLGSEYRIFSYRGLTNFGPENEFASEFVIVAPQDGTEIEITTTCATQGGQVAGVPWTIQLNSGETYQVKAADGSLDLTGSTIIATQQSGNCRPFAVFSGTSLTEIPTGCIAGDHILAQNLPRNVWGTTYHSAPFATTANYTYRLMSDVDGTLVTVNNAPPILLNAGEFVNVNNEPFDMCFSGNQPFAVAQYMQGVTCSGNGDPAMLLLNAEEQRIDQVTFATVVSNIITDHYINIISNTSDIGTITLDGILVPAASFTPFTACPDVSYASVEIDEGSHTLIGPGGFSAYAYGMGTYESYAYSVGSFSSEPPLVVDSVLCGVSNADPLSLIAPSNFLDPYWTSASSPEDTLFQGSPYTFVPQGSDIYVVTGNHYISGCEIDYTYSVEVAVLPVMDVTADGGGTVSACAHEPVQLSATVEPAGTYVYDWWPTTSLSASNIPDPIATPTTTTWYYCRLSTLNDCGTALDSVLVTVTNGDVMLHEATPENSVLCLGDSVQFQLNTQQVVGEDFLNGSIGALWQNVAGGTLDNVCGAVDGDALYFNGASPRTATTVPLNVPNGGTIRFGLKIANGVAPCDDAEPGDNVVLLYSLNGAAPWTLINTYLESNFPNMTMVDAIIPVGAYSANTTFRWNQSGVFAAGLDNWVLDQVTIAAVDASGLTFNWTPAASLEDASIASPWAYPTTSGWYQINTTDDVSSCVYTDSVYVEVGGSFTVSITPDTALCDVAGIQLDASPSTGTGHVWAWSPAATLNAASVQAPIATPTTTTTYSVTVTSSQGCSVEEEVTITVAELLDLDVTVDDNAICAGETVNLVADLVGSDVNKVRTWLPAGSVDSPNAANTTASPATTTMFVYLVVDTLTGCALSDSVQVTVSSQYIATATNDTTVCSAVGMVLSVVHNVPDPAIIAWSPAIHLVGANTASPTVLLDSTMVYVVDVTGSDGCAAYDTTVVSVTFSDLEIAQDTAFCDGGSVTIDAGFPLASHSWNTGETTQMITADTTGAYTVTLTAPNGCVRQHTTTVTVNPLPVVDLGVDPGLCIGVEWILDAGEPTADHVWTNGDLTQTITVTEDGTYGVLVTDGFGCQNSDSVDLVFHPMPVIDLRDTIVCVSETIAFDAGNVGSTYLWSTGETTQTIFVSELTSIISVVVTTLENCVDSADASIEFIQFPLLDLGPDTALCDTEEITFDAGGASVTYLWSTGSTDQFATFVDDAIVWANVNNGYCTSTDTVEVVFNALPVIELRDTIVCVSETILFDAGNPGSTYVWSTGETTQTISVSDFTGILNVVVTTAENCVDNDDASIEFVPFPLLDLGPDTALCETQQISFNAGGPGVTYLWSTGSTEQFVTLEEDALLWATVNNGYCTSTDTVDVVFNPLPLSALDLSVVTCYDVPPHYIVLDAENPDCTYLWNTGETSQEINVHQYQPYTVVITTPLNCSLEESIIVEEYCTSTLYIPNSFTPDGDGINDLFFPTGNNIASIKLSIFDRWGEEIYVGEDAEASWNGKFQGSIVKQDVYIWKLSYRYFEDATGGKLSPVKDLTGHVAVLR